VFILGRIEILRTTPPIATDEVAWSVGRSVYHDRESYKNG